MKNHFYMGFEEGNAVNPGLGFGAERGNKELGTLMYSIYGSRSFLDDNGNPNLTPSPVLNTKYLKTLGLNADGSEQEVSHIHIYPVDYFCPKSYTTGGITISANTHSIHHFNASWHTEHEKKVMALKQWNINIWGNKIGTKINTPIGWCEGLRDRIKKYGILGTIKAYQKKFKKNVNSVC